MKDTVAKTGSDLNRVSDLEIRYVMEALNNQFSNSKYGGMVRRFEEAFAAVFGVRYAIAQVNGTATLHSALAAMGVGPGDEVIVPSLTMMSTCFAALQANAVPVFADVNRRSFTIDPASVESCITQKTKAIITVSLFGLSPDMDPIMALARKHNIYVIEDNAQCYLGSYKGRLAGTIGHMASYSLQISKHITCGEGGVLISNDELLAENARRFGSLGYASVGASASQGKVRREVIQDPNYERHSTMGWNYRLAEPLAAIALAQTERMRELVDQRVKVAEAYAQAHKGCDWLVPQLVGADYTHSWWTYVLALENGGRFTWYDFRNKYVEFGGDGIYATWQLNHLEPALRGKKLAWQTFERGLCPVAESIQPRLLQFKTNYLDMASAERQADVLRRTIAFFG